MADKKVSLDASAGCALLCFGRCFGFGIGLCTALKLTESVSRVAKELGDLLPK